jgi:hypothetical protein
MTLLWLDPTSDGLTLDVLIGLPRTRMRRLQRAGLPIPRLLTVRGIIDNGTNVTCVPSRVVAHFGLRPSVTSSTTTAAGPAPADLYRVSLSLSASLGTSPLMFIQPNLLVMELMMPLPGNIEVLVGRDILDACLFVSDGPRRQFTLSW